MRMKKKGNGAFVYDDSSVEGCISDTQDHDQQSYNDQEASGEAQSTRSSRLRRQTRVDYAKLHIFGEAQLSQQHKLMCKKMMKLSQQKKK